MRTNYNLRARNPNDQILIKVYIKDESETKKRNLKQNLKY